MSDPFERLLEERNAIVHRLTELNSEQLTHQSRRAGVEFQMLTVDDGVEDNGGVMTPELATHAEALETRHRDLKERVERIDEERMALTERLEEVVRQINTLQ